MIKEIIHAKTCMLNDYCTDCPYRKDCSIRKLFYSDDFHTSLSKMSATADSILLRFGYSHSTTFFAHSQFREEINKKREREMELHPTYSIE